MKNQHIANVSIMNTRKRSKKYFLISVIGLLSAWLVSCTTYNKEPYQWQNELFLDPAWRNVRNEADARALLEQGKDLNPVDGASPLLYAPSIKLKELLLQCGADPNHVPRYVKNPPYWWDGKLTDFHPMRGIRSRREGLLLLSYGGKVPADALINFNRPFVSQVRDEDDRDSAVLFLIEQGADIQLGKYKNSYFKHILGYLAGDDILNQDLLKYFKNCGIDLSAVHINQINKPGTPYIFDHCFENQLELLRAGVTPNLRNPSTGDTLLIHDIRQVERRGGVDFNTRKLHQFVLKLLKMGADPTLTNHEGRTAVSYASKDKGLLRILTKYGADANELQKLGLPTPEPKCPHPVIYKTFNCYDWLGKCH